MAAGAERAVIEYALLYVLISFRSATHHLLYDCLKVQKKNFEAVQLATHWVIYYNRYSIFVTLHFTHIFI